MKGLKLLFTAIVFVICSFSIKAQWSTDPNMNTAISTALNKQTEVTICTNGLGGAFMAWRDYRNNPGIFEGDIYAQQIDFSGSALWTADGIIVNEAINGQFSPKIISDDNGGAIIVWAKNDGFFNGYDLYAQRVDSDGSLLWNPSGVAIAVSGATYETFHEIIPDGDGGVILTWMRSPSGGGEADIYTQKLDGNGNILWTANGVAVCTAVENQFWPQLVSDLNGGTIIVWEDARNGAGTMDIYAQRIDENGIAQWSTDGIPVCADQAYQTETAICSDGNGGALVVWSDFRTSESAIYGQRINSAGEVQWITNGKYLSPPSSTCTKPILIFNISGGAYLVWETEVQVMETNIGSQKIDLDGNLLWGTTGVDICLASGNQNEVSALNNMAGGIIVNWKDSRVNPDGDIYTQWIDREGNPKWTTNGVEICGAPNVQSYPVLTTDGLAGAIIAWWDLRDGSNEDIYAQNIDYRGELGTTNFYYQRNNINKPISDGTPTSDTLTVPVFEKAATPIIYDITVKIGSVIHDTVSDLEFTLTHNGISDTLIYRINGNGGVNFTNTFLNDNLGISFGGVAAPFSGIFIPHNALSNFTSTSMSGEWILTITDHKVGDDGILQDWGLLISESSIVEVKEDRSFSPVTFALSQNYPNPFNPTTTIKWQIPEAGNVTLNIFDVLGREVTTLINQELPAGQHETNFDASRFSSGIYFYQLKVYPAAGGAGSFIETKKMILIK